MIVRRLFLQILEDTTQSAGYYCHLVLIGIPPGVRVVCVLRARLPASRNVSCVRDSCGVPTVPLSGVVQTATSRAANLPRALVCGKSEDLAPAPAASRSATMGCERFSHLDFVAQLSGSNLANYFAIVVFSTRPLELADERQS